MNVYDKPKKPMGEYFVGFLVFTVLGVLFYIDLNFLSQKSEEKLIASVEELNSSLLQNPTILEDNSSDTSQETSTQVASSVAQPLPKPKEEPKTQTTPTVKEVDLVALFKANQKDAIIEHLQEAETIAYASKHDYVRYLSSNNLVESMLELSQLAPFDEARLNAMVLDYFIQIKRLSEVEKLLARGYETTVDFDTGKLLIRNRYYSLAMLLIEHDVLAFDAHDANGYTLLHESASKGHEGLLRLLAAKGININNVAYDNVSALHFPAHFGYSVTVGILLELGIDPNIQATFQTNTISWNKSTPLHIAAQQGREAIVRTLLAHNADKSILDANGKSALEWAKTQEIATLLE